MTREIKNNNYIELELFKENFIKSNSLNFKHRRILNWNFILRNISSLKSESFIYLFIDDYDMIEKSDKTNLIKYVNNLIKSHKIDKENFYKIKFLSEHKKPLYWYSKKLTNENFNSRFGIRSALESEINRLNEFLNYHFEILEVKTKIQYDNITEIIFFIKEKYISSEV